MKRQISDDEFAKLLKVVTSDMTPTRKEFEYFGQFSFSPVQHDQMIFGCFSAWGTHIAKTQPLQTYQIENLLEYWGLTILRSGDVPLEYIECGLFGRRKDVRKLAYDHPLCTDAMRVKHDLLPS